MTASPPKCQPSIVELLQRRAAFIRRWDATSSPERHGVLESEAVSASLDLITAADEIASLRAKVDELTAALRRAREYVWFNHKASAWHNDPLAYDMITKVIDPALALNSQHGDG